MIYKVVGPEGEVGYGPTVNDALSLAFGEKRALEIRADQHCYWTSYTAVHPQIDGRKAAVSMAKACYEQALVRDGTGRAIFEVYRAMYMEALKGLGLVMEEKQDFASVAKVNLDTIPPSESERFRKGTEYHKLATRLEKKGKSREYIREAINDLMEKRLNASKSKRSKQTKGNGKKSGR